MTESDYDSGDLSAEPLDPDHLFEYVMFHHDSERLAKLAAGVCLARQSSSGLGELSAVNNTDKIRDEFDTEYDELAAEARQWTPEVTPRRALDELDEYGGKSSLAEKSREHWEQRAKETDSEETDEFRQKVRERLSGRCNMLADEWLATMENLAEAYEEQEIGPDDDIVMCRKADAEAGAQLRAELTREAGIPEDEARELSISSLRRIAGDDSHEERLTPAPKSGDHQADETTTLYEDETKAEELKQRIEFIENHSSGGELMETQRELYEEQLAELEA